MAKGGGGFAGKPVKGMMNGRDYGKAVSSAAKMKRMDGSVADRIKPVTPKTPTTRKKGY